MTKRFGSRSATSMVLSYGVLLATTVFALAPLAWALLTSLKPSMEILAYPPVWIPETFTFEHYRAVLFDSNLPLYMVNTALVAVLSIVIVVAFGAHSAYAATRFRFRGREATMYLILAASMVPLVSLLTPLYLVWAKVGLYDTYIGMALVFAAWQTPTAIWLIRGFVEAVPYEIEEAALIDGCGRWKSFYRIVLPIIQPGLAAAAILIFIFIWNDFLVATALTISDERRLMQVGLYRYLGDYGVEWGRFTAYAMLAVLPVIVLFVLLQKKLMLGLVAGSMKG